MIQKQIHPHFHPSTTWFFLCFCYIYNSKSMHWTVCIQWIKKTKLIVDIHMDRKKKESLNHYYFLFFLNLRHLDTSKEIEKRTNNPKETEFMASWVYGIGKMKQTWWTQKAWRWALVWWPLLLEGPSYAPEASFRGISILSHIVYFSSLREQQKRKFVNAINTVSVSAVNGLFVNLVSDREFNYKTLEFWRLC